MAEEENEDKPTSPSEDSDNGFSYSNKNSLQNEEQELDDTLSPCILSTARWLKSRNFSKIPFPILSSQQNELILLALEKVTTKNAESKQIINEAYDNPTGTFLKIDDVLRKNLEFEQFGIEEKIMDAYLDQYLWYEATRRDLFPHWIKPVDSEPPPLSVYKWCESINKLEGIWDTGDAQSVVMVQTELDDPFKNMDLPLLKQLLCLVLDEKIANYILKNKDCENQAKQYISFIMQYIGLTMDILLTASVTASPADRDSRQPILLYFRFVNEVYMLLRITSDEAKNLISKFEEEYDHNSEEMSGYNNRRCWNKCERMRLLKNDANLGRSVFWDVRKRLAQSFTKIEWKSSFVSVYSKNNPNLLFSMCGFEVRLLPIKRKAEIFGETKAACWIMQEERTKEPTTFVFLKVNDEHIKLFESNLRTVLRTSASKTFIETVRQWNKAIIGIVSYFREAIIDSEDLLDSFAKFENKIQESIKRQLNSKTADRLPTIIFYTPRSLGGLGMLSMSEIQIPRSYLHQSSVIAPNPRLISELFHYIKPWKTEIMHSKLAWAEYAIRRQEAKSQNRCLAVQDVEDLWDLGIPRINTVFQKQQHWKYDKGWRFRRLLMQKTPFWWTQKRHDGKLWNLVNYSPDIIKKLGGIEFVLDHTTSNELLNCLRQRVRKELQVSSNPKTSDLHVDKPLVTVRRPQGQVEIGSETDWHATATLNSKFSHRINQIHVNPVEKEEMEYSYIFPNNILEKFKRIADLQSQIAGYMFGMSSPDNHWVKQIHCLAIPPQWGTDQEVYLPWALPDHDSLKNLEPLGWIYSQSNDFDGSLTEKKFKTHVNILSKNRQCRVKKFIIIDCCFPPGACSLYAFKPYWDEISRRVVLKMVQLVLTDGFLGFYLVPESGMWNYNFKRPKSEVATKYGMTSFNDAKARNDIEEMTDYKMKLGTPAAYSDMVHCPHYFFNLGEKYEEIEDPFL